VTFFDAPGLTILSILTGYLIYCIIGNPKEIYEWFKRRRR